MVRTSVDRVHLGLDCCVEVLNDYLDYCSLVCNSVYVWSKIDDKKNMGSAVYYNYASRCHSQMVFGYDSQNLDLQLGCVPYIIVLLHLMFLYFIAVGFMGVTAKLFLCDNR